MARARRSRPAESRAPRLSHGHPIPRPRPRRLPMHRPWHRQAGQHPHHRYRRVEGHHRRPRDRRRREHRATRQLQERHRHRPPDRPVATWAPADPRRLHRQAVGLPRWHRRSRRVRHRRQDHLECRLARLREHDLEPHRHRQAWARRADRAPRHRLRDHRALRRRHRLRVATGRRPDRPDRPDRLPARLLALHRHHRRRPAAATASRLARPRDHPPCLPAHLPAPWSARAPSSSCTIAASATR